jgi:putative transcriptional regulator
MIKINLSRMLGERRWTQAEFSRKTEIRPSTVNLYYHELIERMNVDDIDKMCEVLNCSLNELMEYVPNKK